MKHDVCPPRGRAYSLRRGGGRGGGEEVEVEEEEGKNSQDTLHVYRLGIKAPKIVKKRFFRTLSQTCAVGGWGPMFGTK